MKNNNQDKLQIILRLILKIILFGIFGWVYFMGIVCPSFTSPFGTIYRGLGIGFIYPLYFLIIPTYQNKDFPDIPYSGSYNVNFFICFDIDIFAHNISATDTSVEKCATKI